ncbi:hypothetical protein D3C78_1885830 [compost metagenome]
MQPGIAVELAQRLLTQMLLNQRGEEPTAFGIQQPHAADMRRIVALLNKLRQRRLNDQVTTTIKLGVGRF